MLGVRLIIQAVCLAVLFQAFASAATPLKSRPLDERKFNSYAIEAFIGGAKMKFPNMAEKDPVSVSDRIFNGLQAAAKQLDSNGVSIVWAFKYKEAFFQSVLIYDASGHPRLLAAADDMVEIARGGRPLATTTGQYQRILKNRRGPQPLITIFVRDKRDLDVYLPYLKRWQQANLLGMNNVNCAKPGMPEACRLAGQIEVPTRAYLLKGKRAPQALTVPNVKAADIPLEVF